ncbi:hypothetical protein [uncultured Bartonella sp.]|uniref:hypothetical protein n=1 Tax=uncultured Bartonella sp. TaxID=104108 RepID=UPI0025EC20AD|nr:hypothetical protein [uncultured Bartonella sp.]
MINSVFNNGRMSGAETALHLLKSNETNQFNSDTKGSRGISPTVSASGNTPLSASSSDAISRIQELIAGKIDVNAVQTGSVYHDTMTSIAESLRNGSSVSADGTITANPNMTDDELKELFTQVMKSHIAQGKITEPGLAEAIQSGKFEIVLEGDMIGNPIFKQGSFKVVGDGYGFISDKAWRSEADNEAINAFHASGKRVIESGIGPMRFGIIF